MGAHVFWNRRDREPQTEWMKPSLCLLAVVFWAGALSAPVVAQPAPGYYAAVDAANATTLRATLHEVIDDHTKISYTAAVTDTWDVLEAADEDPNDTGRIIDIYLNETYPKYGEGNLDYNREHSWPKSYGFPVDGQTNYPYTDCHHLFLCNDSYNSSRNNKPYDNCSTDCTEKPTVANDGRGGAGQSNFTNSDAWETWIGRRGDVARALFYLDVRYEGGTHGATGFSEPDLILTDNMTLVQAVSSNASVAYMGRLSTLLQWHQEDPPDSYEMYRNNIVEIYQGNRNPFIDHPEWVDCIFGGVCSGSGDTTPPTAPTSIATVGGDSLVDVSWADNSEGDLAGYNIYRSGTSGGPYTKLNSTLVAAALYHDIAVVNGTTYHYIVTAVDFSGNESVESAEASATPEASGTGSTADPAWINEIHYDNDGGDAGEFVEIAGAAGTDLSGWRLLAYNGSGGALYDTVNLSGVIPDLSGCVGALSFSFTGLQNGDPDGIALVDPLGTVVQFLSYEGQFTAVGGEADGMTSVNIGVTETGSTPVGYSLQLGGDGNSPGDFVWQAAQAETPGALNTGQTFADSCGETLYIALESFDARLVAPEGPVEISWTTHEEIDNLGFHVYRAVRLEDGSFERGERVNDSLIPAEGEGAGATYRLLDETPFGMDLDLDLPEGGAYVWYYMEDIDLGGQTTLHGPIRTNERARAPLTAVENWAAY